MARQMTPLLPLAVAASFLVAGCAGARFHRDKNAPGIIDVDAPPRQASPGHPEQPGDPGERMFTINPGIFGSGGIKTARDEMFTSSFGAELTFNWGENKRSHYKDGFIVYPVTGSGVSIGWEGLQRRDGAFESGPIYVEASRFRVFLGASLGVALDPTGFDVGPQASAWAGPYYVRVRYLIDGGTEIFSGLQIKVPLVWIWSR